MPSFWMCTAGLTAALLALAYPGWVTNDTLGWLMQARRHDYVDVQPPGSSLFLAFVDPIWPGPLSLVTFNIVVLCAGMMLLWRSLGWRPVTALTAAIAVLAYPAVLTILPVAWRDITGLGLSIATLAAAVALWEGEQGPSPERRRWLLWAAIALLSFLGSMFRLNHAAGVLPIVALPLAALIRRYSGWRWTVAGCAALILATGLLGMTSLAAFRASATVTRPVYSMQAWMTYRLGQMSMRVGKSLYPPSLYPEMKLDTVVDLFQSAPEPYRNVFWKAYSLGNVALLPVLKDEAHFSELRTHFWRAVGEHPLDFLTVLAQDNLAYFSMRYWPKGSSSVRKQPTGVFRVTAPDGHVLTLDINWPTDAPRLSTLIIAGADRFNRIGLIRNPMPITALALALGIIAIQLNLRYWPIIVATATAALAHHAGVVWIAAIYDFRFGHQAIAMAMVAIVLFVAGMLERRRQPVNSP